MRKLFDLPVAIAFLLSLSCNAQAQIVIADPADAPALHSAELGSDGLDDGAISGLIGGTVYDASDTPFPNPQPAVPIFGNSYATMDPVPGTTMTFNFTPGFSWVHFLWGTSILNSVTVTTHLGDILTFDPFRTSPASQSPLWKLGDQSPVLFGSGDSRIFSLFLFASRPGDYIETISFANNGAPDPMWVANFQVNGVPESATWLMLILGFGAGGAALRRRRALTPAAGATPAV